MKVCLDRDDGIVSITELPYAFAITVEVPDATVENWKRIEKEWDAMQTQMRRYIDSVVWDASTSNWKQK